MKVATVVSLRDIAWPRCVHTAQRGLRCQEPGSARTAPGDLLLLQGQGRGESPGAGRSHGTDAQGSGAGGSHLETPSSETWGMQEKDGF